MSEQIRSASTPKSIPLIAAVLLSLWALTACMPTRAETRDSAEPVTLTPYTATIDETASDETTTDEAATDEAASSGTVSAEPEPASEAPAVEASTNVTESVALASAAASSAPLRQVSYTGDVVANQEINMAVEVIGQVLKLNVDVGDHVKAGDVLLKLDSVSLEAQRAQALAGLKAAQAQLDGLLLEADDSDIEAARAGVAAASAAYQRAIEGPTAEDLEIAEAQLRQAEASVKRAQSAYNEVKWSPQIGALPQSEQLEQATLQYEAAQAQFEKIAQGATQAEINSAYAQLASARAQLDRILEGPNQPQIDAMQAQVEQAETNLFLAQVQLNKATLQAPIDGVVSSVDISVGATASPGSPVITLLSEDVKIEIAVEEARLGDIAIGQPVTITVPAYPDRTFRGEIATIAPALDPATRTAQVTVRPTGDADALAPGMFATVVLEQ